MDSGYIIIALALVTIGGTLAIAIFHFGYFLKDPENVDAIKRVAADRESAATRVSSEGVSGRSLRQRLNEAPSINDRLSNRPVGLNPWDVLVNTKWSEVRSSLNGGSNRHE